MADTRTYIRVHDGMPDHPKVDGLSDKAFRLLVTSWCWCSRHLTDGMIPAATWKKRGTPAARKELVAAGLVEELPGGDVLMHDYLEHQRSAEKVKEVRLTKARGGGYGNHVRHHVNQGIVKEGCEHCPPPPPEDPEDVPDLSHMRSHPGSQNGRKSSPVSVSENIRGSSIPNEGSLDHQSADRYARGREDDDLEKIIQVLFELTGRSVDRAHANRIRSQLLVGRTVDNPLGYVLSSIRGEPHRFLPAVGAPWEAPPPRLGPKDPEATERGAAQARAALRNAKHKDPS